MIIPFGALKIDFKGNRKKAKRKSLQINTKKVWKTTLVSR